MTAAGKETKEFILPPLIFDLLPLLRSMLPGEVIAHGEYGFALGGAHAKGVDDAESDVDLYVFAREVLPEAERDNICRAVPGVEGVVSWGLDGKFVQGGTDYYYQGKKIEVWFREIEYISAIIAECQEGVVRHDLVTWTVMGFFNHCTLSDLHKMVPIEDPGGVLARWQNGVAQYPPKMKERIVREYLGAAKFWPENFHYKTAVARCDVLYTTGIVQQVAHNLIQVIFALNEAYFPGEKKLETSLEHLPVQPDGFARRVRSLVFPAVPASQPVLEQQRQELIELVAEVETLVKQKGLA